MTGRPPYGSTALEQLTLDRIAAMRRCGLSWAQVAQRLNKAQARTRSGGLFNRVNVALLFNRWVRRSVNHGR